MDPENTDGMFQFSILENDEIAVMFISFIHHVLTQETELENLCLHRSLVDAVTDTITTTKTGSNNKNNVLSKHLYTLELRECILAMMQFDDFFDLKYGPSSITNSESRQMILDISLNLPIGVVYNQHDISCAVLKLVQAATSHALNLGKLYNTTIIIVVVFNSKTNLSF